ncbi:MAG: helix-turn-helix domain-containing protein [Candidatus Riesia sp.]|nr:helix-turn-helix domain-containing protein [Candidatus Riesia sp.]
MSGEAKRSTDKKKLTVQSKSGYVKENARRFSLYKKNRLAGMTYEEAAIKAGYSRSTARKSAYKIEQRAKQDMAGAFARLGLDDDTLAKFAYNGMQSATKLYGKNAIEHPDWQIKHRFFDSICKLSGRMTNSNDVVPSGVTFNTVNFITNNAK